MTRIYLGSLYRQGLGWHCATSRAVPGSNPGGVGHRDFSRGYRQNHVPWGQLSLYKMSTRDSHGGKGGRCVRLTTLVVPNVKKSGTLTYPDPLGPPRRPVVGETFTLYRHGLYHRMVQPASVTYLNNRRRWMMSGLNLR